MYRKFIATVAAAAIAITAMGVTPAAADNKDTARALAAILGVAVVGKIILDRKEKRDVVTRRNTVPVYQAPSRRHQIEQQRRQQAAQLRHQQQLQRQQAQRQQAQRQHRNTHSNIQPRPLPDRVRR